MRFIKKFRPDLIVWDATRRALHGEAVPVQAAAVQGDFFTTDFSLMGH